MFDKITFCIFVLVIYKVNSQLCGCRPNTVPTLAPSQSSVVVDNSISLGLANALQLLIVSNLLESTIPSVCRCQPNLRPFEIIQPEYKVPFIPSVEINPYPVIETIPPRFYGGFIESVSPICGSYDYPNYFGITETVPNVFGWTEIIAPPCLTEVSPTLPCLSNPITPNLFGISEFSPCQTIPYSPYFGAAEILTSYPPNFGLTEIISTPVSETFSTVPYQVCNNGYAQNILPCINEVPIEGCGCGCGNLIYY